MKSRSTTPRTGFRQVVHQSDSDHRCAGRDEKEKWLQTWIDGAKYSDGSIDSAEQQVYVANDLMNKGDYRRAQIVADAAAQSGAEWAIQCPGYCAEGLGEWDRAEKIARDAAAGYHNAGGWFMFCCRTGHGDKAAARAEFEKTLTDPPANSDAAFSQVDDWLLTGELAKAENLCMTQALQTHDPWFALEGALLAHDRGDAAARDKMLGAVGEPRSFSMNEIQLCKLAHSAVTAFQTGKLDDKFAATPTEARPDDMYITNVFYFAGEIELRLKRKDLGVQLLKKAAGINSFKFTRALAAVHLRQMGIEPPPPGQWN